MAVRPAGVSLGYWQDRPALEALETARLADALGYGELWVGEMATFDAFAVATAVGLQTSSVTLTVGPLAGGVRDPVALAMGVASVAALTGRAVNLAVGSSSPVVVGRWHGRPYGRLATMLQETVEAVRPLLAGERVTYAGQLVHTDGYRLRLDPPGGSLTVAAFGERAVAVAGSLGDRMVVNLCTPAAIASLRDAFDEAARRADREGRVPLAAWVPAAVEPADEAVEQLRRGLVPYLAAPGYAEMFEGAGFGDTVAVARSGARPADVLAAVPVELVEAVGVIGDPATCGARLDAFAAAGVDEVVIVPATAGDPAGRRTLEALAP